MFLSKPVDEELGNQLVATMLYLDSENKKDINLYINCSGGDVSQRCLFQLCHHLSESSLVCRDAFLAALSQAAMLLAS